MKKHENLWRKAVALLLCLVLASTMVACGGTEPDEDLYNSGNGNTTSTATPDDDSVVVIPGGNGEGTGNGNGGNSGTEGNSEEQQAFLNSVPKELAGSKVEILVWYKALDSQIAKMQRFEDATGIKVEFVYADDENYTWSVLVEDPQTEETHVVPVTVSADDRAFIYNMENIKGDTTLFFDDIELFGSLVKTHKDGVISASTSLAYHADTWYWRSETIDDSVEGWPEYVVPLPNSITAQISQ